MVEKYETDLCSWMIPKFPRKTRNRFVAFCRANGEFVRSHLEYLVLKDMRDAGLEIPALKRKESKTDATQNSISSRM